MADLKIYAVALVLGLAVGGCGDKKKAEPGQASEPTGGSTGGTSGEATPAAPNDPDDKPGSNQAVGDDSGELCINPLDLQIEPLDLEALQDEMATVDIGALGKVLDGLARHGTPVPLDQGNVAVPAVRCPADSCAVGILLVDESGKEKQFVSLPASDIAVTADSELEMVSALADVNSDGSSDLWISYRQEAKGSQASTYRVASLSLPDMNVQWHGVVRQMAAGENDASCEGDIYPADADCDGDGDIVLLQRCGPRRCLGDEGDGNPGCREDKVEDRVAIHRWSASKKTVSAGRELTAQTAHSRAAGSKP